MLGASRRGAGSACIATQAASPKARIDGPRPHAQGFAAPSFQRPTTHGFPLFSLVLSCNGGVEILEHFPPPLPRVVLLVHQLENPGTAGRGGRSMGQQQQIRGKETRISNFKHTKRRHLYIRNSKQTLLNAGSDWRRKRLLVCRSP